jgi:hypothetical protein
LIKETAQWTRLKKAITDVLKNILNESKDNINTMSSKSSGWKCFINFWHVIKRYFLKKTQPIIQVLMNILYIMYLIVRLYDWYCNIVIFRYIFSAKSQLVTSYSLTFDVDSCLYIPALSNCKHVMMYIVKLERMCINKHCTVHCNKSKSIHGSTPVYIIIYLRIIKGLCALILHIDYFFIALFDDFKLIIRILSISE